jgi:PAS domain S-box-containing protein
MDEIEELHTILRQASRVLRRIWKNRILSSILECAQDAVIQTDVNGTIWETNAGAAKMLGYRKDALKGRTIADLIQGDQMGDLVALAVDKKAQEVTFLDKEGKEIRVLLSVAGLPEEIGGKVYIAADLSDRISSERLEILGDMYYEISMQTKPRLSLTSSALRRLIETHQGDERQTLEDVLRELHKIELTFDRLARFENGHVGMPYNEALLSPQRLVKDVIEGLPRSEAKLVDYTFEGPLPRIRGDIRHFYFCLESIIGYLLRFARDKKHVRLAVTSSEESLTISIAGFVPEPKVDLVKGYADANWIARTLEDMALGRRILEEYVKNNHGRLTQTRSKNGVTEYRIDIDLRAGRSLKH